MIIFKKIVLRIEHVISGNWTVGKMIQEDVDV